MSPTMRQIVPKELIRPLTILGKHDWLSWRPNHTEPPSTGYELHIPDDPALDDHEDVIDRIHMIKRYDNFLLCKLFAHSKALAAGPKLLRPTSEQCEALNHVDVNVAFDEYEQPFPVFIMEVPAEFRLQLSERFGEVCPRFVTNLHDRRSQYIFSFCEQGPDGGGTGNIMSPRRYWKTIEEALRFSIDEGNDIQLGEVLQRVAVNFGLLLTRFGAKDLGPVDPAAHAKNCRNANRKSKRKADRAKALLAATMNLIDFEQEVVFFENVKTSEPNPDADGAMKRPHWRRGHFRRQPCGEGRKQRKLIFVKPCFINSAFFHGDHCDTEYRIHSQQRSSGVSAEGTDAGNGTHNSNDTSNLH